jgi:hypothetical protein
MRRRIAVAKSMVGHDVQTGFDCGMKCLVQSGVVAHSHSHRDFAVLPQAAEFLLPMS